MFIFCVSLLFFQISAVFLDILLLHSLFLDLKSQLSPIHQPQHNYTPGSGVFSSCFVSLHWTFKALTFCFLVLQHWLIIFVYQFCLLCSVSCYVNSLFFWINKPFFLALSPCMSLHPWVHLNLTDSFTSWLYLRWKLNLRLNEAQGLSFKTEVLWASLTQGQKESDLIVLLSVC